MPISDWVRMLFGANEAGPRLPSRRDAEFVRLRVRRMEERRVFTAVPVATNLSAAQTYVEDTTLNLSDIVVTDDSPSITATLTLSNTAAGSLTFGTFGTVTSAYDGGTGIWTATGSVADVNAALAAVAFVPASNFNADFTITTSIKDADNPAVTGSKSMTGTPVNDQPTLATTPAVAPTFTEGGAAVSLFSATAVSTVEVGQTITRLDLTVSNVSDGASEILRIDGSDVALVAGSGTTTTNGFSYSVSVASGTATISLTKAAGVSTAAMQTMVDGLTYRNTSQDPTAGTRTITLTRLDDNGSNTAPNVNTTTLTAVSTVTVVGVNDQPTLTTTTSSPTFTEGGSASSLFSATTVSTVEAGQTITRLDLTVSNVANGALEILSIDGTDIALVAGSGTTATNGFTYSVSVAAGTATISLTKVTGVSTSAVQTMVNGATYRNTSQDPTAGPRTVTLTRLDDSGSATLPNVNTTTLSAASVVTVAAVNDAPTLTTTPAVAPAYTEGDPAVSLFSATTVSTVEAGQTITRLHLTVSNVSGAGDVLHIDGTDVPLSAGSGTTTTNGLTYNVSVASGTATITLTKAAGISTAAMQTLVDSLTYRNTSLAPTAGPRTVTLTRLDDNGSNTAPDVNTTTLSFATTVTVSTVDDGPTLTTTASNPTFTEGGSAASLFSVTTVSTVEAGQTITRLELTVSNLVDGNSEILRVDGTDIALVAGGGGTTATNGFTYSVSVAAGTATITLTKAAGVTTAAMQTLVNGITYRNLAADPTPGDRTVTLTRLDDNGSNVAPNSNTTTLTTASVVTVADVNDPPTLTTTTSTPTFTEGGAAVSLFSTTTVSTGEAGQTITRLHLTVSNVSGGTSEILNIDGTDVALVAGSGTTATNGFTYNVSVAAGTATITLTKAAGVSTAAMQTLVDGITYRHTSVNPTAGARTVTLTRIDDNGSNSAPSDNTTTLTAASTITVAVVNSAPSMTVANGLSDVDEDIPNGSNTGTLVSDLIAGHFTDNDGPLQGIAVVLASNAFGTWQYATDGTTWNTLTGVSAGAARLLAADATTRIRFVPTGNYNGPSGAIQFRAWDGFTGTAGNTGDASTTGGTSAYGAALVTVGITVTAVNDPPTLTTTISTPTFTEGGTAVSLFSATSISTFEAGQTITRLELTVTNVSGGGDVLNIDGTDVSLVNGTNGTTATNGFSYTVSIASGTATVTLANATGVTTALMQTLVNGITYRNTSDDPTAGTRVVTLTRIDDDGSNTAPNDNTTTLAAASTVTVAAVNDPPSITPSSTDVSYVKGSTTPIRIDNALTVSDPDSAALSSAVVNITNKKTGDSLTMVPSFTSTTIDVVVLNNSTTSRITFTAKSGQSPTAADFQAALRAVRFATGSTTAGDVRLVTFVVNDGALNSGTVTYEINVDKRPVLGIPNGGISYTEDGPSASIAPSGVTIVDDDDTAMFGATITLSSATATDVFEYDNLPAKITATSALVGNVLTLTLVNVDDLDPAPIADWIAAIQSIKYRTTSDTPSASPRTLSFTINDGQLSSTPAETRSLTITPNNDRPVMTASAGATTYTEDSAAVVIDAGLTLVDPDDTNMTGATVTIIGAIAEDQLVFVNQNGITVQSNTGGVLTLTGTTTKANYLAALQSVKYHNSNSNNPTTGNRTISFVVDDGSDDSIAVTKTVTVVALNDAPVLSGANNLASIAEDPAANNGTLVSDLISGRVTDPDGAGSLQGIAVTAVADTNGIWQYSTNSGTSWTAFGAASSGTSRLLFADATTRVRFVPNSNYNGSATGGITFRAWDRTDGGLNGGTADTSGANNGGTTAFSTATFTSSITVTAVNDSPTLSGTANLASIVEDVTDGSNVGTLLSTLTSGQISDPDGTLTGIAVTGVDNTNGTWEYSTNSGSSWTAFGAVGPSSARLLQVNPQTRVRFVPNADFNGTVSGLTFRAWDGTSGSVGGTGDTTLGVGGATAFSSAEFTASIGVTAVNDPPRISTIGGPTIFNENGGDVTLDSTVTVTEVDGENIKSMTIVIVGNPDPNDVLLFTAQNGITGTYLNGVLTLTGTTSAANYTTALRSIQFRNLSDNPVAGNRTISFSGRDILDTDTLTPLPSKTLTVVAANDTPTFLTPPVASITIAPGVTSIPFGFTVGDPDDPPGTLIVTAVSSDQLALKDANIVISGTGSARTVTFTPESGVSTDITVTFTVRDASNAQTTYLVALRVNHPPTFVTPPADVTITEDTVAFVDVGLSVTDVDSAPAGLIVTATSNNQSIIPNANIQVLPTTPTDGNRTLRITPVANWSGDVTITVTVSDGGATSTSTFVVRITPVNDAPTIPANQSFTATEDTTKTGLQISAGSGDNELPAQPLTYFITRQPTNGTIVLGTNGAFTFIPKPNYSGADSFDFLVIDDGSPTGFPMFSTGTMTITVTPVADDPAFPIGFVIAGDENTAFATGLDIVSSDTDGSEEITTITISHVHSDIELRRADGVTVIAPTSSGGGRKSYTMSYSDFRNITVYAPDNFNPLVDIRFEITATSTEKADTSLTATKAHFVPVLIRNVAPNISTLFASNVDANATTNLTSVINDAPRDTFSLEIRWGISKTGFPATTFLSGLSPAGTLINQSFQFLVAPDPSDPSAPIQIELVARDKDGGVSTRTVTIQVPGTGIPTPIVRDLGLIDPPSLLRAYSITEITDVRTTIPTAPTGLNDRRVVTQRVATTERSVEIRKVAIDGEGEEEGHPLGLEELLRLPEFFAKLPDGRYRLYLKENDFTTPRMLADVVVFRGRAVSEGDLQADRPPKQMPRTPTQGPDVPPIAKTPGPNETSADLPREDEVPADGVDGPQLRGPGSGGPGLRGVDVPETKPELQDLRGRSP
jgi:hypothetical protein